MELTEGARVNDNVELLRPLGHGGMGSVWVGKHLTLDREVAVKFISPEIVKLVGPQIVERFQREARAAAKLKSPHVVQTFDCGTTEEGTPYIVMELLEGESLEDHLQRVGRSDAAFAARVLDQIAKALTEAHAAGIVHRDIKPDNIFMAQIAGELCCKLLDFGIAVQATDKRLTATGMSLGTPQYMSPEQMKSAKSVDARTDLWAMGAVIYRMLAGRDAFDGETAVELWMAKHEGQFPPLGNAALDAWLDRALASEPTARFQDAKTMAAELRAAATGARVAPQSHVTHVQAPLLTPHQAMSGQASTLGAAEVRPRSGGSGRGAVVAVAALALGSIALGGFWVTRESEPAPQAPAGTASRSEQADKTNRRKKTLASAATSSASAAPRELPPLAATTIEAGTVARAWVPKFTIERLIGDQGLAYLDAQEDCRKRNMALCTELQHRRACTEHPAVGDIPTWTASLGDERGVVVADSCEKLRTAHAPDPNRAGLCCTRAVPVESPGASKTFLGATTAKLLAFEEALDAGSAHAVSMLFDGEHQGGKLRKAAARHYREYFEGLERQWTIYDRCEASIRNRDGESQWVASCRTISHRRKDGRDEVSLVMMRYVRGGEDGLVLEMTTPSTLRKFGPP